MYAVMIKYVLPEPTSRGAMKEIFRASEERFRTLPGLIRKYFCYDEPSHTGHSFYYWENKAAADAFFNEELVAEFQQHFGATPEFFGVEPLMLVDNEHELTTYNDS